jgi:hypothetical protein
MQDWQHFTDSRFILSFQYPPVTPQGRLVEIAERQEQDIIRIHFTSKDSREVYFEISKYDFLSPPTEYQRHKENLEKRGEGFVVSDLKEIRWMSQPAFEYSLKWSRGTRTIIMIEADSATYRALYDPFSPLNLQILSTLRWRY